MALATVVDKVRAVAMLPVFLAALAFVCIVTAFIPPAGFLAAIGLGVLWIGIRRPGVLLAAAIFFIPFDKLAVLIPPAAAGAGGTTFLNTLTLPKVILLGLIGILFLKEMLLGDARVWSLRKEPIVLLGAAFALASLISMVNAKDLGLFFFTLVRRFNLVVLVAVLVYVVRSPNDVAKLLWLMAAAYVAVIGISIFELATQETFLTLVGYPLRDVPYVFAGVGFRPSGTYDDANVLAINAAVGSLLGVVIADWSRRPLAVCGGLLLTLAGAVVVLGSASRGGVLALVAGLAVYFVLVRIPKKFFVGLAAMGLLAAVFVIFATSVSELTAARFTGDVGTESVDYRFGWMEMTTAMALDHPIVGVGTTQFPVYYHRYIVPSVPREAYLPHNTYLQVWAENGALGLVIFLALWAVAFRSAWRALRAASDPHQRVLAIAVLSILTALGLYAGTSNTVEMEIYWLTFAFATILARRAATTTTTRTFLDAPPLASR